MTARSLRRALLVTASVPLLLLAAAGAALSLAVQDRPTVQRSTRMALPALAHARQWLQSAEGAGPGPQHLRASGPELDALLHDMTRRLFQGAAQLQLSAGRATVAVSLPVQRTPVRVLAPLGQWLNVELVLAQTERSLPVVHSARIGALPVPGALADWALRQAVARLQYGPELDLASEVVQHVALQPDQVDVQWLWRDDLKQRTRALLVPPDDVPRMRAFHAALQAIVALPPAVADRAAQRKEPVPVPLAGLLALLFEQAQQRTQAAVVAQGANPEALAAQENRALLLTLALYAGEVDLSRLVPEAATWPALQPRQVLLRGRDDFALHYLFSAVMASGLGGRLADAVGVYKEMSDARDGSGFSFNDIAADRSGSRFGQLAQHQPRLLQQRAATAVGDSDFMPPVDDLPQFLTAEEFKAQYGEVGAPRYNQMVKAIELRVMGTPVLR
ncbi:MAG: hypothetical protein RJA98_514 [Pseudomonadota bacterium]|jgi:hypothetical protein